MEAKRKKEKSRKYNKFDGEEKMLREREKERR